MAVTAAPHRTWLAQLAERGHVPALSHRGHVVSYRALAGRAETLAARLAAAGVGAGTRIAVVVDDGPDQITIALALAALDAAHVAIPVSLAPATIADLIGHVAPAAIVASAADAAPAIRSCPAIPIAALAHDAAALPRLDIRGGGPPIGGTFMVTSGTAARSKLVYHSWSKRGALAAATAAAFGLGPGTLTIACIDGARPVGMIVFGLATVLAGGTLALGGGDPRVLPELAGHRGDAVAALAPPLANILARDLSAVARPPGLRLVTIPGGTIPAASRRAIRDGWGVPVIGMYGLTETGLVAVERPEGILAEGFRGMPLPGVELRIRAAATAAESGTSVADTVAAGTVAIRSPFAMDGYWNGTDVEPVGDEGWIETGDLARVDSAGRLVIGGRAGDTILVGATNVAPAEIERILLDSGLVADCAAARMDDDLYGEVPVAFVVLRPGATLEALRAAVQSGFGTNTWPRLVVAVAALSLTVAGKPDRHALSARAAMLRRSLAATEGLPAYVTAPA